MGRGVREDLGHPARPSARTRPAPRTRAPRLRPRAAAPRGGRPGSLDRRGPRVLAALARPALGAFYLAAVPRCLPRRSGPGRPRRTHAAPHSAPPCGRPTALHRGGVRRPGGVRPAQGRVAHRRRPGRRHAGPSWTTCAPSPSPSPAPSACHRLRTVRTRPSPPVQTPAPLAPHWRRCGREGGVGR